MIYIYLSICKWIYSSPLAHALRRRPDARVLAVEPLPPSQVGGAEGAATVPTVVPPTPKREARPLGRRCAGGVADGATGDGLRGA